MPSITYTTATTQQDLQGILNLQKRNLPVNLTNEEISSQGFVTVVHTLEDLEQMNTIEQHVIAKDGDNVIAYLLAMTAGSKEVIPVLVPMFHLFENIVYDSKPVSALNYMVVGQVCVDKQYRGLGVIDACYTHYKDHFKTTYDCAITEIDTTNLRSLKAHTRIGFKEIQRYTADAVQWSIVIWDWRKEP